MRCQELFERCARLQLLVKRLSQALVLLLHFLPRLQLCECTREPLAHSGPVTSCCGVARAVNVIVVLVNAAEPAPQRRTRLERRDVDAQLRDLGVLA